MITRKEILDITPYIPVGQNRSETCFFDIETTGFAAEVTTLYLIGAVFYEDDKWTLYQWFADDSKSEEQMIKTFFEKLTPNTTLVTFNGMGFDENYIAKRCVRYNIESPLLTMNNLDIYKLMRPYKELFKLDNLKQKTIEQFLMIDRDDKYSGGDLVHEYGAYLRAKHDKAPNEKEIFDRLILHNEDDLKGLLQLTQLIELNETITEPYIIGGASLDYEKNMLEISFPLSMRIPKVCGAKKDNIVLSLFENKGVLRVPLYHDELKFFYPNYKDYYYIPDEDKVIHKSVSFYVDKEYRTKAKAANCYSKHTGSFVPEFDEIVSPYFKIDYNDKTLYVETTVEFLNNTESISAYAKHIIKYVMH